MTITKVIPIARLLIVREKQTLLSEKIISALQRTSSKQHAGNSFGQKEIDGFFLDLINRGSIIRDESKIGEICQLSYIAEYGL